MSNEVSLTIYDLSRGMARSLSAQFLGPNHIIDIVPHTSILAFGREYYFDRGVGIHSEDPHIFRQTRQMFPTEIQALGCTDVSQTEFEVWCVTSDGSYGPDSYDLLMHNCNNFSHDAALHGLHLPRGVPEWILHIHQRFISSPVGHTIRPILEQMQLAGCIYGRDGNAARHHFIKNQSEVTCTTSHHDSPLINSPTPTPTNKVNEQTVALMNKPSKKNNVNKLSDAIFPDTPIFDSYNRPLLSSDTSMISECLRKIEQSQNTSSGINMLSPSEYNSVKQFAQSLVHIPNKDGQLEISMVNNVNDETLTRSSSAALLAFLERSANHATSVSSTGHVFLLLRLMVLQLHPTNNNTEHINNIITHVANYIDNSQDTNNIKVKNTMAHSMAWCVLSNTIGSGHDCRSHLSSNNGMLPNLIDLSIRDLSAVHHTRAEIRQAASVFLYNLILRMMLHIEKNEMKSNVQTDTVSKEECVELPDWIVTVICGVFQGIIYEKDVMTKMRRLLVAGKILKMRNSFTDNSDIAYKKKKNEMMFHNAVKSLMVDLGYGETILAIRDDSDMRRESNHGKTVSNLATEISSLLGLMS